MIKGRSPTQWSLTGKEGTGDVGPRVVGKGMGRALSGESITANAKITTRRPTNVTETNQYPAFVAYRRSWTKTCLPRPLHF